MDTLLAAINQGLVSGSALALPAAFAWGMIAVVLSPCHLASIPLLIAYVAGQKTTPAPRRAAAYALLFALGLFVTVMVVGLACAALGRMLGDVGPWWQSAVGLLLVYFAWTLWRPAACGAAGHARFRMQGAAGAMVLGLGYGFLSGPCTFGFIAPILGLVTLKKEMFGAVALLAVFALGLCLPLVLCGVFSARAMALLYSAAGQRLAAVARHLAAIVVLLLGLYFTVNPFL